MIGTKSVQFVERPRSEVIKRRNQRYVNPTIYLQQQKLTISQSSKGRDLVDVWRNNNL
jgi:hypothetical protein